MASAFGLAVTNLTSKFGILSRKACIRLATETGEKALVKRNDLGRNLNKQELEQLFAEALPKRCRPKIITEDSEAIECLKRSGYSEEQINAQIKTIDDACFVAANVSDGTRKMKYWMPFERIANFEGTIKDYIEYTTPAFIAHEMEHSLEKNCRVIDIFRRKFSKIKKAVGKFFDKNYTEKVNQRQIGIHEFEAELQKTLIPTAELNKETGFIQLKCKPTVEEITKFFEQTEGVSLAYKLRSIMRKNYASGLNKDSETRKRLKLMKYWMDMERPAYEVTGKMEHKICGFKEDEHTINEAIAKGYESAINVTKQEQRTYWINKLLGIFVKNKE